MTGFSADWLSLREPFDREARGMAAASLALDALASRLRGDDPTLTVLDLACGTGANLRELAPRLKGPQRWTLVDHDLRLLQEIPEAIAAWAKAEGFIAETGDGSIRIEGPDWKARVQTACVDLASNLDAVPFAGTRLVTASALLDLVSDRWVKALVEQVRSADAAMLFALSVDGRVTWDPQMDGDEEVDRLFASHQRRDKGFGPALGVEAVDFAARHLEGCGYDTVRATSDWRIEGASAHAMLTAMVQGMATASLEQDLTARSRVTDWMQRRLDVIDRTRLRIGHQEILAT
ncbi:class I SAM-dependent methyltransferase [Variovorax sp. GT1P44]|uniref:class I SAM-dependent methyltransferase n=1 Tax=Variovorax sp. GT1P44 TaxID=3443742 RepID=UPI003F4674C0